MGHTGTLTRGYGSVGPALDTLTSPEQPARLVTLSQAPAPLRRPAPGRTVSEGPARIPAPRPVPGVVPLAVRPGAPCPVAPRTAFVPPPAPVGLAPVRPVVQHPLPPEGGPMTGVARAVRRALPDPHFPRPTRAPRPARPAIGWGPQATTGRVLLAAVAVGAAMPALQALNTHEAEAEPATSTQVARTDLALAAQRGPAAAANATTAAISAVTTVTAPAADPTAGDASDMAALTKAIGVARENGPLEFGRPYTAGNDRTLDGQIAKALGLLGLPQKLAPGVKKIIMRESTGNPDAINNWDSNASAGTPSKGLMQLIDVSFRNSVLPSLADKGIYDPVANITAGVRFMIANHGIDTLMGGGLRNAAGNYIGYGGSKVPDDGLGLAVRR